MSTSTASNQQQQQVEIEASHEIITEGIDATLDQGTNTEIEVITLLQGKAKIIGRQQIFFENKNGRS